MKNFLDENQKNQLEKSRKAIRDSKENDRIKAVLLANKGWTRSEIAEALFLDDETIGTHIREYRESGKLTLNSGGSESKLTKEQSKELVLFLEEHLFLTTLPICAYVKKKYNVEYTQNGMTSWLHKNNFSYKKPKGTPAKADPEKQKEHIIFYKNLKENTPDDEPVLHSDAVHPSMNTKLECGWIYKGTEKILSTTASRTRVNKLGALELKTMNLITHDYVTINGDSMEHFLRKIRDSYPKAPKIHVILDNGPYNKSIQVQEAAAKLNIKLYFLPAYSPNLNPIERVWKVMNEHVRNNRFFQSAKEFREALSDFFEKKWPTIASSMASRINDNFQLIKKSVVSC